MFLVYLLFRCPWIFLTTAHEYIKEAFVPLALGLIQGERMYVQTDEVRRIIPLQSLDTHYVCQFLLLLSKFIVLRGTLCDYSRPAVTAIDLAVALAGS